MNKSVVDVVQWKLVCAKPDVAFIVEPYFGWIEILDEDPLPDVELLALDHQWMLNILLHHELDVLAQAVVRDVVKIVETADSPPSWHDWIMINVQFGFTIHTLRNPFMMIWGSPFFSASIYPPILSWYI